MLLPDLSYLTPAQQAAFLDSPALAPPEGITQNLINPTNSNSLSMTIAVLAILLSSIFVSIRLYVSLVVSKTFFLTDGIMILCFGLSAAFYGFVLDSILQVGYLVHQWDVTYGDFFHELKAFWIKQNLYGFSIFFIKIAIILEWIRIFNPRRTKNVFYWAAWAILAVHTLFYIPTAFIYNLACRPWERSYNPFIKGKCFDSVKLWLVSGVINFAVDVAIFPLPQNVIWHLRMSGKKKASIAAVFGVGILSIVSAAFRLGWTVQFTTSSDVLYTQTSLDLWLMAEMTSALILFCVPSVPKFLQNDTVRKLFSLSTRVGKSSRLSSSTGNIGHKADITPYQKLEGSDAVLLEPMKPLTTPPSARLTGPQLDRSRPSHLQILRTTEIFISREGNDKNAGRASTSRQDPWMERLV
ncbi:hypothetical protein F4679DRAFT_109637 [Xylaria curta]|nr:hypothetical protein F4679DRAFT_109637 [Xylaria curta]